MAPACRECKGTGDMVDMFSACERCAGEGVEFCGECPVGAPRVRVVTTYTDTCADGMTYESQVCEACARRLTGLIEMPAPCRWCGYVQRVGELWGHLEGPWCATYCDHIHAQRRCVSCTSDWWAPWLQPDWDVDGCAKRDCPECISAHEADAAADAAGEPRVSQVYMAYEPTLAAAALAVALASRARPLAGSDDYRVIASFDARGARS